MELLQDPIVIALLGIAALLVAITALIRFAVDIYLRNRRAQSNRAYMDALREWADMQVGGDLRDEYQYAEKPKRDGYFYEDESQ